MQTMTAITKQIKKARRKGIPDYLIGHEMGVCAAEIKRLAGGKYPGPKVAKRLGLREKCSTCHRPLPRPKVQKQPAPLIGRGDWINYYLKKEIKCI